MTRTINQIIEAVTNADRLFGTLHDIQPKTNPKGRPTIIQKRDVIIVEVEHRGEPKLLLCSSSYDSLLRDLYLDYTQRTPSDNAQAILLENEMTLFDSSGRSSTASVLLVDTSCAETFVGYLNHADKRSTNREWRVEREGVVCCSSSQGVRYTDSDNNPIIEQTFIWGEPLREGRAVVQTENGYGLIDKQGHYLLPPRFEELSWNETTGVCVAMVDGRWSMYDREGVLLTDTTYDWIGEACGNLYPMEEDGQSGFLDCNGQVAIPAEWDYAESFAETLTTVKRDGTTHIIDSQGQLIK